MTRLTLPLLLSVGTLVACAKINDVGMWLVASSENAIAVLSDTVLTGTVRLDVDRTGRVQLESATQPPLRCGGTLHLTGTRSGVANLHCSDGTEAQIPFTMVSESSGYGSNRAATKPASLSYGMKPAAAVGVLLPPTGKRLILEEDKLIVGSP